MHSIVLIAAMSATTGLFGGGKHCGGGKAMHLGRAASAYPSAPMATSSCGGSTYGGMGPSTGMATMQQAPAMPAMTRPGMNPSPAMPLPSPSMTVPPAPSVPAAPAVPAAPPAPPAAEQ